MCEAVSVCVCPAWFLVPASHIILGSWTRTRHGIATTTTTYSSLPATTKHSHYYLPSFHFPTLIPSPPFLPQEKPAVCCALPCFPSDASSAFRACLCLHAEREEEGKTRKRKPPLLYIFLEKEERRTRQFSQDSFLASHVMTVREDSGRRTFGRKEKRRKGEGPACIQRRRKGLLPASCEKGLLCLPRHGGSLGGWFVGGVLLPPCIPPHPAA